MADLDLEALRRLNIARRDELHWNARELARNELQSLLMRKTDAILAALERAQRLEAAARAFLLDCERDESLGTVMVPDDSLAALEAALEGRDG